MHLCTLLHNLVSAVLCSSCGWKFFSYPAMILTPLVVHKVNLLGTMFVHLLCTFTCYVLYMHACVSDMKNIVFIHLLCTLHACMCIRYEERTIVAMEVPILVVRFLTQHWMLPQGWHTSQGKSFLELLEKSVLWSSFEFFKASFSHYILLYAWVNMLLTWFYYG